MSCRASGDDSARFLQELRQLRDGAGLGRAELAARAHYPYDRIRAAEVGPSLPDLPVLSAYVRGCGGTSEVWEERWRSLTSAPTLPLLAARPAGCSTAASAGARIGSISPAADTPDPSIIMAALDRVAEEMAVGTPAALPSRSGISTIEQHPDVAPAAAAAGTAKAAGWEATTTQTDWGTAAAPTAWDADQSPAEAVFDAGAGLATAPAAAASAAAYGATGGAGTPAVENVRTVAGDAGSAGYPAAAAAADGLAGSGGSAATKPVAAAAATTAAATAAVSGQFAADRKSRAMSRTTIAALIVIAICLLVAALAIFA
jgi:Helix-turn-helix domain